MSHNYICRLPVAIIALVMLVLVGSVPPVAAHTPAVAVTTPDNTLAFLPDGAHLAPGVTLRLAAVGHGETLTTIEPVMPTDDSKRVEYAHGDVSEWYVRQGSGVEQGITLGSPPTGAGPLALTIATPGVIPLVDADGGAATLIVPHALGGSSQWRYDGLHVTDVTGRVLPSHLASTDGGVRILVDDTNAVYPITVDPWMQSQTLAASGSEGFGFKVALSGDGSIALVGTNAGVGTAYMYTRGMSGYTQFGPTLAVTGSNGLGIWVALSSDGSTTLVGANGTNSNAGTAYVYTRGMNGYTLGSTLAVAGTTYFGISVALSGDGSIALVGAMGTNSNVGAAYPFVFVSPTSILPAPGTLSQHATVTTAFAAPFTTLVRDGGGTPVPSAVVTFTAPAGGAGGAFACPVAGCPTGTSVSSDGLSATATTDSTGRATSPTFTANSTMGSYNVTATTGDGGNTPLTPVAFYLTNTAGAPASIAVMSGSNGSAVLGSAFTMPLRVRVFDSEGNPTGGTTVTFAAPTATNTPTATFSGSTATTDSNGVASVIATAAGRPGAFSVTASVSGGHSRRHLLPHRHCGPRCHADPYRLLASYRPDSGWHGDYPKGHELRHQCYGEHWRGRGNECERESGGGHDHGDNAGSRGGRYGGHQRDHERPDGNDSRLHLPGGGRDRGATRCAPVAWEWEWRDEPDGTTGTTR